MWAQVLYAATKATAAVGAHQGDPAGAADAAWAAPDFLAAAARVIGGRRSGALQAAAEDYDRAARQAWGRLPESSPAGSGVRAASGLLRAARLVHAPETAQMLALLAQLAVLADRSGECAPSRTGRRRPPPPGRPRRRSAPSTADSWPLRPAARHDSSSRVRQRRGRGPNRPDRPDVRLTSCPGLTSSAALATRRRVLGPPILILSLAPSVHGATNRKWWQAQ